MAEIVMVTDDEDMVDIGIDTGLNASKLVTQDAGKCERSARMLKRQRLRSRPAARSSGIKAEEENVLKEQRLLDDGMTKKMKLDLLKVLAESRKSAAAETLMRNLSPEKVPKIFTTVNKELPVPEIDDSSLKGDSILLCDSSQSEASGTNSPLKNVSRLRTDQKEESVANNVGLQEELKLADKRIFPDITSIAFIRPDGVDPNEHAKVILEQMNGYHEYLKVQQRQSLNLMEWGTPITATGNVMPVKRSEYSWSRSSLSYSKEASLSSTSFPIEIESCSSSESSHEEFAVCKKSPTKNVKKLRVKKAPIKLAGHQSRGTKFDQLDSNLKAPISKSQSENEDWEEGEEEIPSIKNLTLKKTIFKKAVSNEATDKQSKSRPANDEIFEDKKDPFAPLKAARRCKRGPGKEQAVEADVFDFELSQDSKVKCPLCDKEFHKDVIEAHASGCFATSDNETVQNVDAPSEHGVVNSSDTELCFICKKNIPQNIFNDHLANCEF